MILSTTGFSVDKSITEGSFFEESKEGSCPISIRRFWYMEWLNIMGDELRILEQRHRDLDSSTINDERETRGELRRGALLAASFGKTTNTVNNDLISVRISFKADIVFVFGTGLQDLRVEEHLTNLAECKDNNCLNSEAEKESVDFISRVNERSLPKAPWDEGIC
nr:methyl-CpG-binding domain-containing protein 9-like [Ipomoea batatas]